MREINSLLFDASVEGRVDAITSLLDRGADIESQHLHGATALHAAAARGHIETLELLLKRGANPNSTYGEYSVTALQEAAVQNNIAVAVVLLNNGANVNQCDVANQTALDIAYGQSHTEMAGILIKYGAKLRE